MLIDTDSVGLSKIEDCIATIKQVLGNKVDVTAIGIDLDYQASVKAAAEILEKVDRFNALICNGAIAQVPTQVIRVDRFKSQLGVNYYGHSKLQALLFPPIENSNGRIVTVGSLRFDTGIKTIKFDDMNWAQEYQKNDHPRFIRTMSN